MVSDSVIVIGVDVSDLVSLFVILYVRLEECFGVDLKYLFSALDFCVSVWAVLLLWVMVVLVGVVGFLGLRAFTVDHRM